MIAEMQAAANDGVVCIVDGGHTDMGRSVEFLRELSERSGMPIVASGGYYHQPTYPPGLSERSEDDLVEELVRDAPTERWGALGKSAFQRKVRQMSGRCFEPSGGLTCRPTCRSSPTPPTGLRRSGSSTCSNRWVSTPDAWPLGTSGIRSAGSRSTLRTGRLCRLRPPGRQPGRRRCAGADGHRAAGGRLHGQRAASV